MQYLSSIVDHKATLAEEAQTLGAQLKARAAEEATVMMHRAAALGQLQSDQNTLMSAFAQLEMQLVQMAQARAQISVLLVQLAKQLVQVVGVRVGRSAGMDGVGTWHERRERHHAVAPIAHQRTGNPLC